MERHYPFKLYLHDTPTIIFIGSSLALNIASFLWLALRIRPDLGQIFLHYNILFGVDLLGTWYQVFFIPAIGLLILIVNAVVGWLLFHRDKFAGHLLNFTSVMVQLFVLVASGLLIFLNV